MKTLINQWTSASLSHGLPLSVASCLLIYALWRGRYHPLPALMMPILNSSAWQEIWPQLPGQSPVFLPDRLYASQTNVHSPALALPFSTAASLPEPLSLSLECCPPHESQFTLQDQSQVAPPSKPSRPCPKQSPALFSAAVTSTVHLSHWNTVVVYSPALPLLDRVPKGEWAALYPPLSPHLPSPTARCQPTRDERVEVLGRRFISFSVQW